MAGKAGKRSGSILVIGGGEDPDQADMTILPRFVAMAGGRSARIFIYSAPPSAPRRGRGYAAIFKKIGVSDVHEAALGSRAEADRPEVLEALDAATGVFFTGDDQLRLATTVAGTKLADRIEERLFSEGLVLGGTGAGAAALGSTMIIGGADGGTVRRADVELSPGFGWWRDTVIDPHFNDRGRVHRLLTVFAHNPQVLGIGLDENTALELVPGKHFTVIGSGTAMVFDGRVTHTNAAGRELSETLALTDSLVHVLSDGYGFNLESQRPVLPSRVEIPPKEVAAGA